MPSIRRRNAVFLARSLGLAFRLMWAEWTTKSKAARYLKLLSLNQEAKQLKLEMEHCNGK